MEVKIDNFQRRPSYSLFVTFSFVEKTSGAYTRCSSILKFFDGKIISLYRFKNFIKPILASNRAKCLPMHVLPPALKPPNA